MEKYKALRVPIARRPNHASILIIGGAGKLHKDFAEVLTKICEAEEYFLTVHIADELPLKTDCDGKRNEVDLIIILINAGDRHSFESAGKSLQLIPLDYFQGRILMVVHKPKSSIDICVEYERISILANSYMCPALWDHISLTNEHIAMQVMQKIKVGMRMLPMPPSMVVGNLRS